MESNHQPEEVCSVCLDILPKLASNFTRMICCGKGLHNKCYANIRASSMSQKQKAQCIMCRTKHPCSDKESVDQLRPWVEKGKAWAQCILGSRYEHGKGVDQSYQQARALRELAANQGHANALYDLGCMYAKGEGVDQSYEKAKEYFEAAASRGDVDAQKCLGNMNRDGLGVDQNYEKAKEYYEAAASQGIAEAQYNLGVLYANGQGVEQSFETAREWWMKSAEQGQQEAIKALQRLDIDEGRRTPSFTPPKRCSTCDAPKTSTRKLRNCKCKGAQYCNAECQRLHWKSHQKDHRRLCKKMELTNTEGEMKDEMVVEEEEEEEEEGETKETTTADFPQQEEEEDVCPVCIEPLQKDSAKFVRMACCGKGIHKWCYKGIKVSSLSYEQKNSCPLCRAEYPDSEEETIEQVRRWVEKGKAWAQFMLGQWYDDGRGVDQSDQQAKVLYDLAASQGDATAQYELGIMYKDGQGVDQSYERAAEYYEAAAMQGMAGAQCSLGIFYVQGQGVEQSNEKAHKLWMKSAQQGFENAIGCLQKLDKQEGRTTPSFVPKPFECATCYRPHDPPEHKLRPCKRCHRAFYCGKECQVKHWKEKFNGHKQLCNKQ